MPFRTRLLTATLLTCIPLLTTHAAPLRVGSGNEAVIEPSVPVPNEVPCTVPLVTKQIFGADAVPLTYAPPTACPGPWAKVVLKFTISLNQGRQFDRTGTLFLAGIPLWYGTTAEPRATLSPNWTFEKDVTDYTAIFGKSQAGVMQIANYVSSVYTSSITASAALLFYPPTTAAPAPVTADVIVPLPTGGGLATLNTPTDTLATTATLPTNILRATVDLYLQGQSGDEFWYTCAPSAIAGSLLSCGATSFREGEISIDGTPAGVAPISPWIFTGGIDPYLWQPIPGAQTFDFTPFHADLSPFAGVLSNGAAHTITTSVYNANGYFLATGALRLFLDKSATKVTGAIIRNTLKPAAPHVSQNITTTNGVSSGTVTITSKHDFTICGTVTGSAGTTTNTLTQTTHYTSSQRFDVSNPRDLQVTTQSTKTTITTAARGGGASGGTTQTLNYPLFVYYDFATDKNGNSTQVTSVNQQFLSDFQQETAGLPAAQDTVTNAITTADTLFFDPSFTVTGHKSQSETAVYARTGTSAPCFKRTLVAKFNVLTAVQTGC